MKATIFSAFMALMLAQPAIAQVSPLQNIQFYRDVGDLADMSAPYVSELGNNIETARVLRSSRNDIEEALRWSGQPLYIIELPSQEDMLTRRTLRVGTPRYLGVGSTPAMAVVNSKFRPPLDPPPRMYGPDRSVFVVVQLRRDKAEWGLMPYEAVNQVKLGAAAILADEQLTSAQAKAEYGKVLSAAVDRAQRQVRNREERERIQRLYHETMDRDRALQEIKDKLAHDLAVAEQANKAVARLRTVSAILSVSQTVMQLQAAVPELPGDKLAEAKTPAEALAIATNFAKDRAGNVTEFQMRIDATGPQAIQTASELTEALIKAGAPREVITRPKEM